MADDSEDSREQGIEFGSLGDELETESYPLSHEALLDRHGDSVLRLVDGETTLREVLPADQEQTYEDAEGVRQTVFAMVGDGAIGRDEYTDRGGATPGEGDADRTDSEPESF